MQAAPPAEDPAAAAQAARECEAEMRALRQAREQAEMQALSRVREEMIRKLDSNTASPDHHAWGTHQQALDAEDQYRMRLHSGMGEDQKRRLGCR